MTLLLTGIYVLLFSIASFFQLRLGIFLILLSLPGYLIRFSFFGIPFTLLELQIYLLFLLFLIKKKRLPFKRTEITFFILLFLLSSILSVLIAPDLRIALGLYKGYFIIPVLFYYLCVSILSKKDFPYVNFSFFLLITAICLMAILQYTGVLHALTPWIHETPKRVTSLFDYPNAIGLLLVPILAYLLAFYTYIKSTFLSIASMAFGSVSILLAWQRNAFFAFFFLFIFVLVQKRRFVTLFSVLFLSAFLLFTQEHFHSAFISIVRFTDTSLDVRLALWQGTVNLLWHHPIFGSGLGGFSEMYAMYKEAKHTELLLYPHTIFLSMWVHLGLFGLFSFILLLFYPLIKSFYWKGQEKFLILFPFFSFLLLGLFDEPYFKNDLSVLFFFWLALFSLLNDSQKKPRIMIIPGENQRIRE